MKQKSTLKDFETSRIDVETSAKKKGGSTSVTSGRLSSSIGADCDCRVRDCNNIPADDPFTSD